MAESTMRPNIRIEIHNNLVETMDVDNVENKDEEEEGEISDANDTEAVLAHPQKQQIIRPVPSHRIWPNSNGGFTTGINIFDKEEQSKLLERAKRFALDPSDLKNFTDEQLQELHDTLGITKEEEKDVRFEAIHMRGTDELSSEDIFEYFGKYGPAGIEWINDESCNIVWNDKISSARALFFLSKPIRGMPVEGPCNPFTKELESTETENKENEGRSILLKNTNREVELQDDYEEDTTNSVHITDITVPIPPGYWRLGGPHPKCKFVLLRFAFKSDKKPMKAEKFSEYYKKHGNPNFGGMKGIITESRKQRFKGIFDRNRDIKKDKKLSEDPKNPWGALAMNWDEDARYCEKEVESVPKPNNLVPSSGTNKSDIMNRLGFKRSLEAGTSKPEESNTEKKTKVPRMRMYADEEEEKIKRKRQLQELKVAKSIQQEGNKEDLRNILKVGSKKNKIKVEDKDGEADLGSRLKNRNNRLHSDKIDTDRHRGKTSSVEKESVERHHHRDIKSKKLQEKEDKGEKRRKHKSAEHYEMRLHSDRQGNRKKEEYYEDHFNNRKPKSKIAIVIKTQKKPLVASTVWSRIHSERERLKTVSEGKLRVRKESTSSESESSSSESSSSNSVENSDTEDSLLEYRNSDAPCKSEKITDRPGFEGELNFNQKEHRSPLRIEISNDHFKKQ